MEDIIYYNEIEISKINLVCWEEFNEIEDKIVYTSNVHYEGGLVKIDSLINILNEFKEKGANYVACDYHCDHQELDLVAIELRPSTDEEIDEKKLRIKNMRQDNKLLEIEYHKNKLKELENE